MHEFSIASGVVEAVLAFAAKHGVGRIVEVRMVIGELTCVDPEQLKFCFESITTETPLAGATLVIDDAQAAVRCPHCQYEGPPKYWDDALSAAFLPTLECPQCGRAAEPIAGHDCAIKSIRFVSETETDEPEASAA
jgi:hydrogenase nickel incorporation protein HypA/HybF